MITLASDHTWYWQRMCCVTFCIASLSVLPMLTHSREGSGFTVIMLLIASILVVFAVLFRPRSISIGIDGSLIDVRSSSGRLLASVEAEEVGSAGIVARGHFLGQPFYYFVIITEEGAKRFGPVFKPDTDTTNINMMLRAMLGAAKPNKSLHANHRPCRKSDV